MTAIPAEWSTQNAEQKKSTSPSPVPSFAATSMLASTPETDSDSLVVVDYPAEERSASNASDKGDDEHSDIPPLVAEDDLERMPLLGNEAEAPLSQKPWNEKYVGGLSMTPHIEGKDSLVSPTSSIESVDDYFPSSVGKKDVTSADVPIEEIKSDVAGAALLELVDALSVESVISDKMTARAAEAANRLSDATRDPLLDPSAENDPRADYAELESDPLQEDPLQDDIASDLISAKETETPAAPSSLHPDCVDSLKADIRTDLHDAKYTITHTPPTTDESTDSYIRQRHVAASLESAPASAKSSVKEGAHSQPAAPLSLLEDIYASLFVPGVTPRVQQLMNMAFAGLFISLSALAVATGGNWHVLALLAIAVALFLSVQWFLKELAAIQPPQNTGLFAALDAQSTTVAPE
ncbi:ER protein Pkr1-domain-containing protein [Phlyctochytrium arcticum]|nr:ER protein Pkr1-domain-containing protein [Phlyctochytrium arcticum]